MAALQFPVPLTVGQKEPGITYTKRHAIRVVAYNSVGEVAIIYASRDNYYKLPGGGIDPGEDHDVAARREMQEETGASIQVRDGGCVATTEEFRNDLHQMSFCYCADLVDATGQPSLTEDEVQDGLKHLWVTVEEAEKKMDEAQPTSQLGRFIRERDLYLLRQATKA